MGGASFFSFFLCFFDFFFFERTRPAASMRPSCLIYLSTSNTIVRPSRTCTQMLLVSVELMACSYLLDRMISCRGILLLCTSGTNTSYRCGVRRHGGATVCTEYVLLLISTLRYTSTQDARFHVFGGKLQISRHSDNQIKCNQGQPLAHHMQPTQSNSLRDFRWLQEKRPIRSISKPSKGRT